MKELDLLISSWEDQEKLGNLMPMALEYLKGLKRARELMLKGQSEPRYTKQEILDVLTHHFDELNAKGLGSQAVKALAGARIAVQKLSHPKPPLTGKLWCTCDVPDVGMGSNVNKCISCRLQLPPIGG